MEYIIKHYDSPLGSILLAADDTGVTGLWFAWQKYFAVGLGTEFTEGESPAIEAALKWLDIYFAGRKPDIAVPVHFIGTPFQLEVWEILRGIPYGETTTYGQIAATIAERRGIKSMSAQAVGGAVGRNPVSVIVPCHRVIGADGSLTGYAGGLDKKVALLTIEGTFPSIFPSST